MILFKGMPERLIWMYFVSVPSTDPRAGDIAGVDKIRDDALHGPQRQTHVVRDVLNPDARILRDADKRVSMVGEEGPSALPIALNGT